MKEIAESLTKQLVPTIKGGTVWSDATVRNILHNEKYCGDVLMQKTITVDCFSHKVIRNTGQKPQYRLRNHHPPIIERDEWEKTQILLQEPRLRSRKKEKLLEQKFRPIKVKTGDFKGFIIIDSTWHEKEIKKLFDEFRKDEQHDEI